LDSRLRGNDNVALAATAKQKPQVKPGAKHIEIPGTPKEKQVSLVAPVASQVSSSRG